MNDPNQLSGGIYVGKLYDPLIAAPLDAGCTKLTAVSGYSSAAFVRQLVLDHPILQLDLVIGMAAHSGISAADHRSYLELIDAMPDRVSICYCLNKRGVHAKAYAWYLDTEPTIGFIGSPNLSWSGMQQYVEAAVEASALGIIDLYSAVRRDAEVINSSHIEEHVKIIPTEIQYANEIERSHGGSKSSEEHESFTLTLLTTSGEMHTAGGLNWGQREGRNHNQAYIPIPQAVHKANPEFFPPPKTRFIIHTDDKQVLVCVVAQQGRKAIETPDDNASLGQYFRHRLGLEDGAYVEKENLIAYGRTDVTITKIDQDIYLMDFSSTGTTSSWSRDAVLLSHDRDGSHKS